MRRIACISFAVMVALTGLAAAEKPQLLVIDVPPHPAVSEASAPYNTIFLNRCAAGCTVTGPGSTDSRIDKSEIVSGSHVLTKFTYGDATWTSLVACVRDVFSPFNVQVTDVDPGSASHFEIMIGGNPQDLGFGANVGGVSPNGCGDTYIPNALVFDFADVWSSSSTTCGAACLEDMCATAAQEIGHSFGMDHSHNSADPMTYFNFVGRKYFQNLADQCGSDCTNQGGQIKGPMGNACSGTDNQVHTCCRSAATQNSFATLNDLFGPGTPVLPNISITNPKTGASVKAGFPISVSAMADSTVKSVSITVDGVAVPPILMAPPFAFNAPATLEGGSHVVVATATDAHGTTNTATITVNIGPPCTSASECPNDTDACIEGRCVPGPNADGGLGTSCTDNSMCGDSTCASDGDNQYCTTACSAPGACPDGFGCLPTADGSTAGFCWPGYNDGTGGGGCNTGGSGGPITGGLLFAALLLTRRKRA
jgi:uncharacterized protein (TIGR03382 family)